MDQRTALLGGDGLSGRGGMDWITEHRGSEHSVTTIGGGSGVGKVSAICSFTARSGEYVIWVQFGSASLYTEKFWRAFVKALGGWDGTLGTQLAGLSLPETIPEISKFATLLNATSARAGRAIVVFENVHLLKEGVVKSLLDNFAHSCTVGIATVMISGEHVDVASAQGMRSARKAEQEIQFTREEIRIYYTALGIVLDSEVLDVIWQLTGGWTQAVYLMSKNLSRGELLTADYVDNAIIFMHKYFQEECHAPLRPEAQQALILFSMLDGFTMAMGVELTALTVDDLKDMVEKNHFICYRSATNSYYFHRLYQQFLEGKQVEVSKKMRLGFLRKAAHWYEQRGWDMEALACSVSGQDYDRVGSVLQRIPPLGLDRDQARRIVKLLEQIPQDYMDAHPRYRLYMVFAMYFSGEPELASRLRERLGQELLNKERSPEEDSVLGEVYISKAFMAWRDGSIDYMRYMAKAGELMPGSTSYLDAGERTLPIGGVLQFMEMGPGDLERMKEMALESIPINRKLLPRTGPGFCYAAAAEAHMYCMEFDEALEYANRAVSESALTRQWGTMADAYYLLQRSSMADGDLDDILSYGEQVHVCTGKQNQVRGYTVSHISRFHESIYFGLFHLFEDWAKADPMVYFQQMNLNLGREMYIHALYKVCYLRQYYPALTYIDNAMQVCRTNGMWFSRLKLVLLKAIVYDYLDKPGIAAKCLLEAYRISAPNNVVFSFLEFGEDMVNLIIATRPHLTDTDIPVEWLERIAAASKRYETHQNQMTLEYFQRNPHLKKRMLAHLTKREYRALQLVCMGKTTGQAAALMEVIPATINTYVSRAYKKLGVQSKEEAVRIAKAEGILEG